MSSTTMHDKMAALLRAEPSIMPPSCSLRAKRTNIRWCLGLDSGDCAEQFCICVHVCVCIPTESGQNEVSMQGRAHTLPPTHLSSNALVSGPWPSRKHNTARHSTTQGKTAQHTTTQHNTAQHNSATSWRSPYGSGTPTPRRVPHC